MRKLAIVLMVWAVAAAVVVAVPSSAAAQTWFDEVRKRDQLIAAQENLLNAYRCRFQVDIGAVKGGCSGGQPARLASPGPVPPYASAAHSAARDSLIAAQESLLNVYRCRFNIDVGQVPGGCSPGDSGSADDGMLYIDLSEFDVSSDVAPLPGYRPPVSANQGPQSSATVTVHLCAQKGSPYTITSVDRTVSRLNSVVTPFFSRQSSNSHSMNFVSGAVIRPDPGTKIRVKTKDMGEVVYTLDWNGAFTTNYTRNVTAYICLVMADRQYSGKNNLVLLDMPIGTSAGGNTLGFAFLGSGNAIQPTEARFIDRGYTSADEGYSNQFYDTAAHELGHSILRLCHPHERGLDYCPTDHDAKAYVSALESNPFTRDHPEACSLMSYCSNSTIRGGNAWIACGQREILGWPNGPATPHETCSFAAGGNSRRQQPQT